MTGFWIVAAALSAVAVALVLPALLGRTRARPRASEDAVNVSIYRDQLRELEADLEAGTLSRSDYEEARREIHRRVLEDVEGATGAAAASRPAGRWTALAVAVAIPVLAGLVYLGVGRPDAMRPDRADQPITRERIEQLVEQLAQKMKANPDDAEGWTMLARSYAVLDRYPEAVQAYEQAIGRSPPDAQLLADYADALAMTKGRTLVGEPEKIIARALAIDPGNVKALALAGAAAFEKHEFDAAIAHWRKILERAPPDSEIAQSVRESIADAERAAEAVRRGAKPDPTAEASRITGTVRLAPALAGRAAPDDTVFIFARAAAGSRLPLAVTRRRVRDLPAEFRLDDSMAMTPAAKLSGETRVVVGARVSKSGNPVAQPGDLEGFTEPVAPGTSGVTVTIDRVVSQ